MSDLGDKGIKNYSKSHVKTLGRVGAGSHQAGCQQSKHFIRGQQQMSAGTRVTSMECRSCEMTHTEDLEGKRATVIWAKSW